MFESGVLHARTLVASGRHTAGMLQQLRGPAA